MLADIDKGRITMGIHTHRLIQYEPGERIHFWGNHEYNIMATGVERIEIDLEKVDDNKTKNTMDYFETLRFAGLLPIAYRSGGRQEPHRINTIFRQKNRHTTGDESTSP